MPDRPHARLVPCPKCGKEYSSHSISIHEPKCRDGQLSRQTHTVLFKNSGLTQNNGRTSVKSISGAGRQIVPVQKLAVRKPSNLASRPPFDNDPQSTGGVQPLGMVRISYMNGAEFGTDTYVINRPTGPASGGTVDPQHDLHNRLKSLPPTVMMRPGRPGRPLEDELNEMAYQQSKRSLVPCQSCGRTFLPDRLPSHVRLCKKK